MLLKKHVLKCFTKLKITISSVCTMLFVACIVFDCPPNSEYIVNIFLHAQTFWRENWFAEQIAWFFKHQEAKEQFACLEEMVIFLSN